MAKPEAGYIRSDPSLIVVTQRRQVYIEVLTWGGADAIGRAHKNEQPTAFWVICAPAPKTDDEKVSPLPTDNGPKPDHNSGHGM